MALSTEYIIKYLADIRGAVQGAKQIENINVATLKKIQDQYGGISRIIGNLPKQSKSIPIIVDGKEALKTVETVGFAAQAVNGKFLELSTTTTRIGNDFKTTGTSVKDVTSQFVKGNLEAEKGNKVFSNLADNVKQLAGRAILTIPIWIALRSAITGVFQGISGGIKNLIDFDLSLQKIRNNLQGTPEEVEANFKRIRSTITQTAKETGIATTELADAVKQFATLGFSANESLQGALGASKLAIALFGDAGQTAGAFARALNILIDRSEGAASAVDQMNSAFALASQLEETNAFELKDATEALDKFAGTAAGVGLTMNQTLSILAALGTAGRRGSEGAVLLATSFNTLLTNIPRLSKSLGIVVINGQSTFDTFKQIVDKITELNNTPGGQPAAVQAISEVFGGARGIKIVQSLVAVKDTLDANIATIPDFNTLVAKAERTMNTVSGQAKILGTNMVELGKDFISAIVGPEEFLEILKNINTTVKNISEPLKTLGTTIKVVFDNLGLIAGAAFLLSWKKAVTVQALFAHLLAIQTSFSFLGGSLAIAFSKGFLTGMKVLGSLAIGSLTAAFTTGGVVGVLARIIAGIFSAPALITAVGGKLLIDAFIENMKRRVDEKNQVIMEISDKIIQGLKGNLSAIELSALIKKLTVELPSGKNKIVELGALRKQLQKQIENINIKAKIPVEVEPIMAIEESQKIAEELVKKQISDQQSIARLMLQNKLAGMKAQGASNSELIKAEILGTANLKIEDDKVTLIGRQLELQRALNEEKELEGKIGNESLKLFEIAQTNGEEAAKVIGDVLSGTIDFNTFVRRGGENLELFKTQFAGLFKQIQAEQYFKGERVAELPTLRRGEQIAIKEEFIRQPEIRQSELQQAQIRSEQLAQQKQLESVFNLQASIPINLNTTVDISRLDELAQNVVNKIAEQGAVAGTKVNDMLKTALLGKQGQNL
jgi:TP901 family phage tail tape measure protein